MENNIMTYAEAVTVLEARVSAYNAKVGTDASGATMDALRQDVKASAEVVKNCALSARLEELLALGERDMFIEWMNNRDYTYTAVVEDKDSKLLSTEDTAKKVDFSAIDRAYFDKHKRKIYGRGDYARVAYVLAWKARHVVRDCGKQTGNADSMKEVKIGELTGTENRATYKKLCAENPNWQKTSKGGFASMVQDFSNALFGDFFDAPAFLRNADRWNFAVKQYDIRDNGGVLQFSAINANKVIHHYFDYLRQAYNEHDYTTIIKAVTGNASTDEQPAEQSTDEQPAEQ